MDSRKPQGEKNPFAGRINLCLGSGSLEGEGKVAAFMTEGKRFFSWLSAEGVSALPALSGTCERSCSVTAAVAMCRCSERNYRHGAVRACEMACRTLDGTRSFTIMYPHFAVAGALS